ncbi:MAG TPA: uracil-DNA glycosylase family protein [Novosphingobium sp.]|nr:uracil-DNA glycosylase family protein [Novosphingobium sp.]
MDSNDPLHSDGQPGGHHGAPPPDLAAAVTAALAWWNEAGVDGDFHDAAQPWLAAVREEQEAAEAAAAPVRAAPPPPPPMGGEAQNWPTDLAAFAQWWLDEASLDNGQVEGRVLPRGVAGSALMIVVPQPEAGDAPAGQLLSGPQGRLLAAMLAAMGVTPEQAYVASALPRHTPHPDWAALAAGGLGAVLTHHIGLAAPQRLILLGASVLSLLGHDPTKIPAFLTRPTLIENIDNADSLPLMVSYDPAMLLERPKAKAGFWRNWLAFSAATAGRKVV